MSDWIEWKWTEEKPYPETLETKVYVKCHDGYDECKKKFPSSPVGEWHWDIDDITHYKLA